MDGEFPQGTVTLDAPARPWKPPRMDSPSSRTSRLAVLAGPALALVTWTSLPEEAIGEAGRSTAALAAWMALWWLTEAVPLPVTALLPVALLPLAGLDPKRVAAPYAHPLVFLFLGGFLIALAVERWNLHRRIALRALLLAGTSPWGLMGALMGVTALLSMWTSNTATAVVMVPIVRSLVERLGEEIDEASLRRLRPALALAVAYAASIGGMGTLVGTAPNLFLASFSREELGAPVDFARWMRLGLPLVGVMLPAAWWLLCGPLFRLSRRPIGSRQLLHAQLRALGPLSRGERATAVVFVLVAIAWTGRPWLVELSWGTWQPLRHLTDASVALLGATVLFLVPAGDGERVLSWREGERLPWGILLLFGGGLSLAWAMQHTGVTELLGRAAGNLSGLPLWLTLLTVCTAVVFLTEVTSNTATTTTLLPVVAAVAPALGTDPLRLATATALSASCAFMLPVATPPNAVVFGSGYVSAKQMRRAGLALNLLAILLVPLAAGLLAPWALR